MHALSGSPFAPRSPQLSILGTPFDEAGPFKAEGSGGKNHLCTRFEIESDLDIYMPELASLW